MGEVSGGQVHERAIDDDEEEVAEHGGGARQEPVRLFTGGLRLYRAVESQVGGGGAKSVDPIGNPI